MKIMPTLALAACSIGLFSAIPAVHAQTGWYYSSIDEAPQYPVQQTTGNGSGSATMNMANGNGGVITLQASASASGSGAGF